MDGGAKRLCSQHIMHVQTEWNLNLLSAATAGYAHTHDASVANIAQVCW